MLDRFMRVLGEIPPCTEWDQDLDYQVVIVPDTNATLGLMCDTVPSGGRNGRFHERSPASHTWAQD